VSVETAARAAKALVSEKVPLVYVGIKQVGDVPTGETAVVFGVVKKKPLADLQASEVLPRQIDDVKTDVVEVGKIVAFAYTERRRPCPPGYSVGHYAITAGTLGAWVTRVGSSLPHILSNNHVVGNSNNATLGDAVLQPGTYDKGTDADRMAVTAEFVTIRFEGIPDKKKAGVALWRAAKWLPNTIARAVGCPNRLVLSTRAVAQPYPNLADAAIAAALHLEDAAFDYPGIGRLKGVRDLVLSESVVKWGRTTERTEGIVAGLRGQALVSYGPGRNAMFDDQIVVGPPGFSAPGDSGSAILTPDGYFGALLFAGSDVVTLGNKASTVMALLGLALP